MMRSNLFLYYTIIYFIIFGPAVPPWTWLIPPKGEFPPVGKPCCRYNNSGYYKQTLGVKGEICALQINETATVQLNTTITS